MKFIIPLAVFMIFSINVIAQNKTNTTKNNVAPVVKNKITTKEVKVVNQNNNTVKPVTTTKKKNKITGNSLAAPTTKFKTNKAKGSSVIVPNNTSTQTNSNTSKNAKDLYSVKDSQLIEKRRQQALKAKAKKEEEKSE